MTRTQIFLLISLILNVVLGIIILAPQPEPTPIDTLADHKQVENDSINQRVKHLEDSINMVSIKLDSAVEVAKHQPIKIVSTYEQIESLPDSAASVNADSILSSYKPMFE